MSSQPIRNFLKQAAKIIALCFAAIPGLICWMERRACRNGEAIFAFWAHFFAILPGHPGVYLRRAFYQLTLDYCSTNCFIGFGSLFSHRNALVNHSVYIGCYALIGSVRIGEGALVGSRVSILSGAKLHELDDEGHWTPTDLLKLRQVAIGKHVWIGEGAIIMADIGDGSMVAGGGVVSAPVPNCVLVAGNPARFVHYLIPQDIP